MEFSRLLDRAAERHPERVAIDDQRTGKALTYRELRDEVRRIGSGLAERGDPVIGLYGGNRIDLFALMFAGWDRGLRVAEIKPRTSAGNLPFFVEDAGIDLLAFDAKRRDETAAGREDLDVDRFVQVHGDAPDWSEPLDALRTDPAGPPRTDPDTVARLGYTSGTTGRPKGVPHTFDRIYHTTQILVFRDEVRHGDRVCLIYPYYGVGQLELLASMLVGATVIVPPGKDPDTVLQTIERERITSIGGVPTQLKDLAEAHDPAVHDTSSVRYVHTGSGLLTEEVYSAAQDAFEPETFCTSYGTSEAGETCYYLGDGTSIGTPHIYHRVRLVEPGSGDPEAEVEGSGELIVDTDSPMVFDGYWNRPEKTDKIIIDGWYFTGDVVRRDEDGRFHFRGRVDDMIISGGENIAPAEIDDVLNAHPDVRAAGVAGVPSERWGEKVVGFVVGDADAEELDRWCRESDLEDFKRPKEYVFVDDIPTSETGGVRRRTLRERYES